MALNKLNVQKKLSGEDTQKAHSNRQTTVANEPYPHIVYVYWLYISSSIEISQTMMYKIHFLHSFDTRKMHRIKWYVVDWLPHSLKAYRVLFVPGGNSDEMFSICCIDKHSQHISILSSFFKFDKNQYNTIYY